jgi:hypothetical protein
MAKKHIPFFTKVLCEIDKLEVGEEVIKTELIIKLWGKYDVWIDASFRVNLCHARKLTDKKFITDLGIIKRTE